VKRKPDAIQFGRQFGRNLDWNLLKFPDKEQALENILDLTMLSDIFPTGYHGALTAGVTTGSTVYVAGRRTGTILEPELEHEVEDPAVRQQAQEPRWCQDIEGDRDGTAEAPWLFASISRTLCALGKAGSY
jgi:hypothetical protein